MSTTLALFFPISMLVLYLLKMLSVLCKALWRRSSKRPDEKNPTSGALQATPQQNATSIFHHTAKKTSLQW